MKLTKLLLITIIPSLLFSCEKEHSNPSKDSSITDSITPSVNTASSFVMSEHTHSDECSVYSNDSEHENLFLYQLNIQKKYDIIGINNEEDLSSITELRIPLTHNGADVTSVLYLNGNKLTSCTKITFPETFDTIKNISDFSSLKNLVFPRKMNKLEKCNFVDFSHDTNLDIRWVEDCYDFNPPSNDSYKSISYPFNCKKINIPENQYVFSMIIYGNAKEFTDQTSYHSNITEVYCLSNDISDKTLKEKFNRLKSIKRDLAITSNIIKVNEIYFFQDDDITLPIGFDFNNRDVVIFPNSINGKKYGIKEETFFNTFIPKNVVFSKEIQFCEAKSFVNTSNRNYFFETETDPENFDYWFFFVDAVGGTIKDRDSYNNIYHKSEWSYVNGVPTPNE